MKPPRLDGAKVGVFSSRSPHRPNPIGLTLAKLDAIVGNTLLLSAIDLLDGTPVLDIKPYVPDYDKPSSLVDLELESSDQTLCQNMDILKSQGTVNQPVPIPLGTQLVNQNSTVPMQEILDLKPGPTNPSIAEWIRKPPIKELSVTFRDDAVVQIGCFHGKMPLREHRLSNEWYENSDNLPVQICTCLQMHEEESFAFKATGEEPNYYKQDTCNSQSEVRPWKQRGESSVKTNDRGSDNEEFKLPSHSKASLDKESNEVIEDVKCDGLREEIKVSLSDKVSLVYGNLEENMFEVSQSVADSDVLQPSGVCIYQLQMLSSPEEAKQAITDILKADPRSVYRRNRCQDQLYHFSIDTMNVTCKFEESTVEVLRVEPVFYRKLKSVPQGTQ